MTGRGFPAVARQRWTRRSKVRRWLWVKRSGCSFRSQSNSVLACRRGSASSRSWTLSTGRRADPCASDRCVAASAVLPQSKLEKRSVRVSITCTEVSHEQAASSLCWYREGRDPQTAPVAAPDRDCGFALRRFPRQAIGVGLARRVEPDAALAAKRRTDKAGKLTNPAECQAKHLRMCKGC